MLLSHVLFCWLYRHISLTSIPFHYGVLHIAFWSLTLLLRLGTIYCLSMPSPSSTNTTLCLTYPFYQRIVLIQCCGLITWCPGRTITMTTPKRNYQFKRNWNCLLNSTLLRSIIWKLLGTVNQLFLFKTFIIPPTLPPLGLAPSHSYSPVLAYNEFIL